MPTLAERLRTETRELHAAAERSRFMSQLLRGRMTRASYGALLRNLHPIYATLEPAMTRYRDHPSIAPLYLPPLWREPALADDLVARHGSAWADGFALQPAAQSYVDRLRQLDAGHAELLVAHAYVRYLGDLSGGQVLRRIVADSLPMAGNAGMSFYDFGKPEAARELSRAFREGLGQIGALLLPAANDALVAEAMRAFGLHRQLFDELADACGVA
jgi:heme oxygenase